ncbi:hypothetical protein E4U54_007948 [Claviceps lovelessii]|nr:hypothetical protein E4U54_007948 [Claviceps lovelessii]
MCAMMQRASHLGRECHVCPDFKKALDLANSWSAGLGAIAGDQSGERRTEHVERWRWLARDAPGLQRPGWPATAVPCAAANHAAPVRRDLKVEATPPFPVAGSQQMGVRTRPHAPGRSHQTINFLPSTQAPTCLGKRREPGGHRTT